MPLRTETRTTLECPDSHMKFSCPIQYRAQPSTRTRNGGSAQVPMYGRSANIHRKPSLRFQLRKWSNRLDLGRCRCCPVDVRTRTSQFLESSPRVRRGVLREYWIDGPERCHAGESRGSKDCRIGRENQFDRVSSVNETRIPRSCQPVSGKWWQTRSKARVSSNARISGK